MQISNKKVTSSLLLIFLCVLEFTLQKKKQKQKCEIKTSKYICSFFILNDFRLWFVSAHKLLWSQAPQHPKQNTSWLFLKETREYCQSTKITPVGYIRTFWRPNSLNESPTAPPPPPQAAAAASLLLSSLKPGPHFLWYQLRLNLVLMVTITLLPFNSLHKWN